MYSPLLQVLGAVYLDDGLGAKFYAKWQSWFDITVCSILSLLWGFEECDIKSYLIPSILQK